MDSWLILVLFGSGLIHISADNATTVSPSLGITRLIKTSTTESVKEENKTSNPTSSVISLSEAPTFSPNRTLEPTYVTTVNSSHSDNGAKGAASADSGGTTISPNGTWLPGNQFTDAISPNGTWLPDNQFTDARTESWEGNSSTAATTPETFPPAGNSDSKDRRGEPITFSLLSF
ncbi:receptor-type tyrosine-protein phosphatase alpha [Onychomys torridus]|uniref:receptor-type tyrosine-protein phosphatase alpha n=1 Tax=Onychomys torridus TaxID=38674 RepID=UPI00167F33CA|nr:receptor-type tyrosine-protein phosphatase alpha [Onychomys torridus]